MHVENILTIGMCGALAFLVIRMSISKLIEPERSHLPWILIASSGVAFCIARVVGHTTTNPDLALYMVRLQYTSAMLLPVLSLVTVEGLGNQAPGRATHALWALTLPLCACFMFTPWFIDGPPKFRTDIFGMTIYTGRTGFLLPILAPALLWLGLVLRSRLREMPPRLAPLRRMLGFAIGSMMVLGLNDSLHGSGVITSLPLFEYAYVIVAIISTRVELQRSAIVRAQLAQLVDERGRDLESKRQEIDTALHQLTRSEERYRHLAEATREGVVVCNGRRVIDVNSAFCTMLGTTEAALLGADAPALFDASDRPRIDGLVSGTEVGPLDVKACRPDQALVAVSVKAAPVPTGAHGTRVLLVRDVSGERELQQRLIRADRLAAVGSLAAGTAHEINNPLVWVVGNAEVLKQELERLASKLPPGELDLAREVIGEIAAGGERVRRIVKDLMSLAREKSTDESSVDVRKVIDGALVIASTQLRHRARVVKDYADVPTVHASEVRLGQVFLNLIVNAAQAIPEGRVAENQVRIKVHADANHVIVEITDTGSGMDSPTRDRIFDPFFTTKEVGKGTGLGLSISHGIVSTLGGTIDVESELVKGTTFIVRLPARPMPEVAAPLAVTTEPAPPRRILVVDDEEAVARNLARMLGPHSVDVAHNGSEALERCATSRYDVVICDLMMPDVTGVDVYTQLVARDPTLASRFLLMTGGAFTDKAREFLDKTLVRCLEKPISTADLHAAVAETVALAG